MQETIFFPDNYCRYLTETFEARSLKNPSYSLRAYARDLGIAVSTLTEILKGKYGPSLARAGEIAKALQLSEEQSVHFLDLVTSTHSKNEKDKMAAQARVKTRLQHSMQSITIDGFQVISDWYHLALLEIISLPGFDEDISKISTKIGLPELTIQEALNRLERLGLVEKSANKWIPTDNFSSIGNSTPSQVIRKFHRQVLEKAIEALECQGMDERENSSTIFSIHKDHIPMAKEKMLKFRREFSNLLTEGSDKNDVYCLSMQFFSMTRKENNL